MADAARRFQPRPAQRQVLDYRGGYMGVAAVPGSGKTQTLSALAADLVARQIDDDQEVLIVTLVNSAVGNFAVRISGELKARGLPPRAGYRVRTLHGLAHDIVRERPGLVGLADDFAIIDDRVAGQIVDDAVMAWLRSHPGFVDGYLREDLEGAGLARARLDHWPDDCREMVDAFIRRAKDERRRPEALASQLSLRGEEFGLARLAAEVYADYQRSLSYRGAVDFADLVGYAIDALRQDPDYRARLAQRWPFILEDEAQDSSALQQQLLELLAGPGGNWVRVGDPNQAVYQTFTTANPQLLRGFLERPGVTPVEMDQSGRSALPIITLANALVDWTRDAHPLPGARQAFRRQHIRPTDAGDPQPNPVDHCELYFHDRELSPDKEVADIVSSLVRWLPQHPDETVAVLVPDNARGARYVEALQGKGIACVELLNASAPARDAARRLGDVLGLVAQPGERDALRRAFAAWHRAAPGEAGAQGTLAERVLSRCREPHAFLWPRGDEDYMASGPVDAQSRAALLAFRAQAQRWLQGALLPVDQLVLTVAQDLFSAPAELALAHQFAVVLRGYAGANPTWRLPELVAELREVATNPRRKFLSLAEDDNGFNPDDHKGEVVVATIHKAKGLEWDRIYLTALNNYDFPAGQAHDVYRGERWYLQDGLNLGAEALAQLAALGSGAEYVAGEASQAARLDYICERLRLLYVGITRARKDLILTWNSGRRREPCQRAVAFIALRAMRGQPGS
ncbi:MAG TPA: ATP-dependent helicase [Anaerolineae bacterium]|nr:ATP-dependent helicase [Anaerolineae bacterium]HOR00408.1 ATP-dependent helicase [Anaerolineae bacterium]HPL28474.1 ATP-dependent helicase [Anaerolineae bacterium]